MRTYNNIFGSRFWFALNLQEIISLINLIISKGNQSKFFFKENTERSIHPQEEKAKIRFSTYQLFSYFKTGLSKSEDIVFKCLISVNTVMKSIVVFKNTEYFSIDLVFQTYLPNLNSSQERMMSIKILHCFLFLVFLSIWYASFGFRHSTQFIFGIWKCFAFIHREQWTHSLT